MLTDVLGAAFLITGWTILPRGFYTKALYMVAIGSLMGILMNRTATRNRVDIILEEMKKECQKMYNGAGVFYF